jgi:AraC family transcriptional regulator of adaptative response/methylated-DNA-[protein]-cysteine methyltransferase
MTLLPSEPRMYRAVAARDAGFEGTFVFAVRTTGVFCRPGCAARTPVRGNCRYFPSAAAALRAGFRPCRRCRPQEAARAPASVQALLDAIGRDPGRRITDADLRAFGIDPSTARRAFRRHCGMTFQACQRSLRMAAALGRMRTGMSVTETLAGSGYASFSGFASAFARTFGAPPSRAPARPLLLADLIPTPLGPMAAVADDAGLWLLDFEDRGLAGAVARIRHRDGGAAVVPGRNAVLRGLSREIAAYFAGTLARFETPVHLEGPDFHVRVWRELMRIPPGETRTYAEVAAAIGRPGACRAVGRANGANPIAIVVPCHRVIRSDGTLCGYGAGAWRKRRLLEIEARTAPAPARERARRPRASGSARAS